MTSEQMHEMMKESFEDEMTNEGKMAYPEGGSWDCVV